LQRRIYGSFSRRFAFVSQTTILARLRASFCRTESVAIESKRRQIAALDTNNTHACGLSHFKLSLLLTIRGSVLLTRDAIGHGVTAI
jgi:hypothetical protein